METENERAKLADEGAVVHRRCAKFRESIVQLRSSSEAGKLGEGSRVNQDEQTGEGGSVMPDVMACGSSLLEKARIELRRGRDRHARSRSYERKRRRERVEEGGRGERVGWRWRRFKVGRL